MTTPEKIRSYADLEKLIHSALRIEHPEWIANDGESEMCNSYEARFAKLLGKDAVPSPDQEASQIGCF
jgi:hypothetical protein